MSLDGANAPALILARRVACWLTASIALVVLVGGWGFGVPALRNIVPGTVEMKALTAVGLLLGTVALTLLSDGTRRRRVRAGRVAAGLLVGLGSVVLGEYFLGWRLGIDELLFRDETGRALGIAYPGRFAPTTAIAFVLSGLALLTLDLAPWRRWRPSEILLLPVAAIATMTIIGYLYEIPVFYGPASAAKMAINTGAAFFLLAAGVLVSRPRGRLVELVITRDPGGIMMRRLLPLAIVMPLGLGWACLQATQSGLVGQRLGIWWLTLFTVLALALMISRVAGRLSQYAQEREGLEAELQLLASHDSLTGLFNRRRFDEDLLSAAARVERYGEAVCLMIIDFDRMKQVNDELGHAAGDRLLSIAGSVIKGRIRSSDAASRLGGDEFAVLLAHTDERQGAVLADALRSAIGDARAPAPGGAEAWTTVSIGVAAVTAARPDGAGVQHHADEAMYAAKRAGGDRVAIWSDDRIVVRGATPRAKLPV